MSLRIILVRPKEPANVGSCARAMKNFGLSELYLVEPLRPIDARAYALSSHAGEVLDNAVHCNSVAEAVEGMKVVLGTTARVRKGPQAVYSPREAAETLPSEGVAVLFGPEDHGLNNDDLSHAHGYVVIPTSSYASLNLAQAVQLIAYEWFVAKEKPDVKPKDLAALATRERLEPMYAQMLATLKLIGYTDEQRTRSADGFFRAILDRAGLNEHEVAALRGLWSQISWAAQQNPERFTGVAEGLDKSG